MIREFFLYQDTVGSDIYEVTAAGCIHYFTPDGVKFLFPADSKVIPLVEENLISFLREKASVLETDQCLVCRQTNGEIHLLRKAAFFSDLTSHLLDEVDMCYQKEGFKPQNVKQRAQMGRLLTDLFINTVAAVNVLHLPIVSTFDNRTIYDYDSDDIPLSIDIDLTDEEWKEYWNRLYHAINDVLGDYPSRCTYSFYFSYFLNDDFGLA